MIKSALTRLSKGTLVYGIGGVIQRFIFLLLLPFLTEALSPQSFGVLALFSLLGAALSGLISLGTGNSMGVLYFSEKDREKRPSIVWTNCFLISLNSIWLYAVLYFLAPQISQILFSSGDYADLLRLNFIGLILIEIGNPFLNYLRLEERLKVYIFITLSNSIIAIILSIWFVLIEKMGLWGMVWASVCTQSIMFCMIIAFASKSLRLDLNLKISINLIRVGFPSIFGVLAFMVIDYADRQMIEHFLSLDILGVYSIGYSFGMIIMIATSAFGNAWPAFFMSYAQKPEEGAHIFARVLSYYILAFGSLVLLFFAAAKPMVLIMTTSTFNQAFGIVGIVAAAYMLKGVYLILLPGVYFVKKLYWQSILEWGTALLNLALNFWFIPRYGMIGAAFATLSSYILLCIFSYFVSQRFLLVPYEGKRVLLSILLIFSCACAMFLITYYGNLSIWSEIIGSFIMLVLFVIISYLVILNQDEKIMIRNTLTRLRA